MDRNPYSEDVMQEELTKRIEALAELDTDTATMTLTRFVVHLMEMYDFELNRHQMSQVQAIALGWASDLETGHWTASAVAADMVKMVRDNVKIPDDKPFWESVYEHFPTKEDAATAYLYTIFSPFMAIGIAGAYLGSVAAESKTAQQVYAYFSAWGQEARTLAYVGLGLTTAGFLYTVLKED